MAKARALRKPAPPAKKGTRAEATSDWLAFIRPHFEKYRVLPWGKQKEFIDTLSSETDRSANTLRRYIAAADFLEGHGIEVFPKGRDRLPVAGIEAIARITKKDPAAGRDLLNDLLEGRGTIRGLKRQLEKLPKKQAVRKKAAPGAVSVEQLGEDIETLLSRVSRSSDWRPPSFLVQSFSAWTGPMVFTKAAWPKFLVPLLGGHNVVVFDEAALNWAISPAIVTREFVLNIAAAVALFDFVVVYCNALQTNVERCVAAMREDLRSRILIRGERIA